MSLALLSQTLATGERHAAPFLVLGDPTPDLTVELAVAAVSAGASMLELGMPFSDPSADGPAIQAAIGRARAAGVSTDEALAVLARIHEAVPGVPLNLLVYGNLVHARGLSRFAELAAAAGASSLLVPDLPLGEDAELAAACMAADLGHVHLVAPSTDPARLAALDRAATGFLYLAAYQGVTGASEASGNGPEGADPREQLHRVAERVRTPLCLGFGLSRPDQLDEAFDAGVHLCVVGSHLARAIEAAWDTDRTRDAVLGAFLRAWRPLAQATLTTRTTPNPDPPCSS